MTFDFGSARARVGWCIGSMLLLVAGCPGDDGPQDPAGTTSGSTGPGASTGDSTVVVVDSTGSDGSTDSSGTDTGQPPLPARLGVTADFQARSLSVIDLDAIAAGARTREQIVARTIELSEYAPGPLQVELAPDGVTAVVAVSPGFFGGFIGGLIGATAVEQDGTLLIVDLETEAVTEIATVHVPMGLAITPDGSTVFTANYGLDDPQGSTMSVVDLGTATVIDEIEVGARPEQVALSADGSIGMLNTVGLGAMRSFATDDPAGTLSEPLVIGNDPSDVAFVPGTSFAVATNSLDPSNYVVIDLSDPSMPTQAAVGPSPLGSFYAVAEIPGTTDVVLTATDFTSLYLRRASIGPDGTPTEAWERSLPGGGFPLGVAVDGQAGLALVAAAGPNGLWVQDLETDAQTLVPWQDEPGPTYVAIAP